MHLRRLTSEGAMRLQATYQTESWHILAGRHLDILRINNTYWWACPVALRIPEKEETLRSQISVESFCQRFCIP